MIDLLMKLELKLFGLVEFLYTDGYLIKLHLRFMGLILNTMLEI